MSSIDKLTVIDSRIVQPKPTYNIYNGGVSITSTPTTASNATPTSMQFTVQVPSQQVFMDRSIELTARARFKVVFKYSAGASTTTLADFGTNLSLPAFPLQQIMENLQITINGQTVSQRQSNVLNELLRMSNMFGNHSQRGCPTQLDKYGKYIEAANANQKGYQNAFNMNEVPNGAFHNVKWVTEAGVDAEAPKFTNVAQGAEGTTTAYFEFTSTEKLVISPFIYNELLSDSVGLFGINTMTVVINFSPSLNRLLRYISTSRNCEVQSVGFASYSNAWTEATINSVFRNPSLLIPMPKRNTVPYMEITDHDTPTGITINPGSNGNIKSQTITLNQIADYMLIYVRPRNLGSGYGDCYLPINRISLNFANVSGLLSSMTKYQLFEASAKNSLNMDYNQYCGRAHSNTTAGSQVYLTGGFVILRPGIDFALPQSLASGVGGKFSIQVDAEVSNHLDVNVSNPYLTLAFINSGFFMSENGSSSKVLQPITEGDVVNSNGPQTTSEEHKRLLGGSFLDKIGSTIKSIVDNPLTKEGAKITKNILKNSGNEKAQMAGEIMGQLGAGKTTGGRRLSALTR